MAVITTRSKIMGIVDTWKRYGVSTRYEVLNNLEQLDLTTVSVDEVNKIVGMTHLTLINCDMCNTNVDTAIEFEVNKFGDHNCTICESCLKSSIQAIGSAFG